MSTGIAVGTSTVVHYSEDVRYWEGPLSEVPLYTHHCLHDTYLVQSLTLYLVQSLILWCSFFVVCF